MFTLTEARASVAGVQLEPGATRAPVASRAVLAVLTARRRVAGALVDVEAGARVRRHDVASRTAAAVGAGLVVAAVRALLDAVQTLVVVCKREEDT